MTFDSVEQSTQSATPVELYAFTAPTSVTLFCTYGKDITYGGQTYKSVPGSRSNLVVGDVAGGLDDLVVTMPASHALPQSYVNGVPPREISVTVLRYHVASGVALMQWSGFVSGLSFRGTDASWRVPSGTADALRAQIPSIVCSRLCQHVLYGNLCGVSRGGSDPSGTPYTRTCTVTGISADGSVVSLSGTPFLLDDKYFVHGEILHAPSTERRTITLTSGAGDATVQVAFPAGTIQVGDTVQVYAGCDHTIEICYTKFRNVVNFGGIPYLPASNVFYVGLNGANYGSNY